MKAKLGGCIVAVLLVISVVGCGSSGKVIGAGGSGVEGGCPSGPAYHPSVTDSYCGSEPGGAGLPPVPGVTAPPRAPAQPAGGAVRSHLSSSDERAIVAAFESGTGFQADCTLHAVKGTLAAATVTATGVTWAFGQFNPPSGCKGELDDEQVDILKAGLFVPFPPLDGGVFEKQPGRPWRMNSYESNPFPCPADLVKDAPGMLSPYLPLNVLNAVGVSYAPSGGPTPNCTYPIVPRLGGPG